MSTLTHIPRFARFLVIGAGAVGLNMILYALLVGLVGVPYMWATALIFTIGNAYGFAANRVWTYDRTDRTGPRMALYYGTMLVSLGLNLVSMLILVDGLGIHYLFASVVTTILLAPVLYFAHGRLAFRKFSSPAAGITVVTHYFPEHGGGVEVVAGELATRIAVSHPVRWFASGSAATPTIDGLALHAVTSWNGIERRVGLPIPIPTPRALGAIVAAVRTSQLVWVHDVLYIGNLAAAVTALFCRTPLIVTVHVGEIPYRRRAIRKLMSVFLAVAGGIVLTRASAVAFVSERVRREFVGRWSLPNARLIPNGVDTEVFRPLADEEIAAVRHTLGLGDGPVALFVGRFVERKGLDLLGELAREIPSVSWIFAGAGPIDPESWSLPNVHVLRGWRGHEIAGLYALADLVVLPSMGEGFPLVVQEALATGARVLIDPSTAAGFPAVASYVECESVSGQDALPRWSSRISQLIRRGDDIEQQRERVAFARESWSWDGAADSYRDLIETAIHGVKHLTVISPARP